MHVKLCRGDQTITATTPVEVTQLKSEGWTEAPPEEDESTPPPEDGEGPGDSSDGEPPAATRQGRKPRG